MGGDVNDDDDFQLNDTGPAVGKLTAVLRPKVSISPPKSHRHARLNLQLPCRRHFSWVER
jgi:hypothetical protein